MRTVGGAGGSRVRLVGGPIRGLATIYLRVLLVFLFAYLILFLFRPPTVATIYFLG